MLALLVSFKLLSKRKRKEKKRKRKGGGGGGYSNPDLHLLRESPYWSQGCDCVNSRSLY